jgi:hypothetical protein
MSRGLRKPTAWTGDAGLFICWFGLVTPHYLGGVSLMVVGLVIRERKETREIDLEGANVEVKHTKMG